MGDTVQQSYTINTPDYKAAINEERDFFVQFNVFNPDVEAAIIRIFHRYLEKYDILYIKDTVLTVLKELINNAVKANVKRLFFKGQGLDINNNSDYRQGMESFKNEIYSGETNGYFDKLASSSLVVRIAFKASDDMFYVNVINNAPILDSELKKIQARVSKAYKYQDISDAFDDVLDDSEGAGLGLIMALMLFKNSGFPSDAFKIYKKDNLTIVTLSIPKNMTAASESTLTDVILQEIKNMPVFPQNIIDIQELCKKPDTPIKEIAEAISHDPGLTATLLKMANSAGYMGITKTVTIEEAIIKIGLKDLNILLVASGIDNIVESKYKRFESIWQESYKRSFYARMLASKLSKQKLVDTAYLGSLLADIGRIVLLSLDNEVLEKLKKLADFKGIENTNLLEEISLGISHATLGAVICRKWNFSDMLTDSIEYHHRPHVAPSNYKDLIYLIYLADALIEVEKRKTRFEFINEDVLAHFKLDKEKFDKLHETLKTAQAGSVKNNVPLNR